jgi:hypothetical protein
MSLIAKDKGGTDYEPLSIGMHHAVCYGIVDLGTQPGGKFLPKRQVAFLWEVPAERITLERDGAKKELPRGISSTFTLSLSAKSRLRPMLESWRGRPFTEAELAGFDLKNVLGANCFLNVIHKAGVGPNAGKTYANVMSVSPLAKGMPRLKPENAPLFFSLDECGSPITVPAAVPDWLKGKIMQSEECVAEQRRAGHPEPTEDEKANLSPPGSEEEEVEF